MRAGFLVTVIMSVYNDSSYIDEAIQSILQQTYTNFEFIIFDDASTDDTAEKIIQYTDKRIIFIQNKLNLGLTKNLNYGLRIARGKYVLRMDGDDISLPERFEKQITYMEEHPRIALAGSWMKCFGVSDKIVTMSTDQNAVKIDLVFDNAVFHPTFIIRKEFIDNNGIQYDESIPYAQDYMLAYQISKKGGVANLPVVLLNYRTHKEQISLKKAKIQKRCADKIRKKILRDLDIQLSNKEFSLWCDFSVKRKRNLSWKDVIMLRKIANLVIIQNRKKASYSEKRLQDQLESRLKNYYKSNFGIIKQVYEYLRLIKEGI